MIPRIVKLEEKMIIGQNMKMSLIESKTGFLWGQFSPRLKEIPNRASEDKISMQVYPPMYHKQFHPNKEFEKWATVEVHDFKNIPDGMKSFILQGRPLCSLSHTRVQALTAKCSNIFFLSGCQHLSLKLMIDLILKS